MSSLNRAGPHTLRWQRAAAVALLGTPWVTYAAAEAEWTDLVPALQECVQSKTGLMAFNASPLRTGDLTSKAAQGHWKPQGDDELRLALADCESREAPSRRRTSSLVRKVVVRVQSGEVHPAWDSSDRLRLQDLIEEQLRESVDADPNLASVPRAGTKSMLTIQAKLTYGGSQLSNRYLDQWIAAPRQLQVSLQLRFPEKGRSSAQRIVALNVPPQFKTTSDGNSASHWMQKTLSATQSAVADLLDQLKPDSALYAVHRGADGKLHVDLHDYTGASAGMYFLLIPALSSTDERAWQVARFDQTARLDGDPDTLALELADGDTRTCSEQPCVAWLL